MEILGLCLLFFLFDTKTILMYRDGFLKKTNRLQ